MDWNVGSSTIGASVTVLAYSVTIVLPLTVRVAPLMAVIVSNTVPVVAFCVVWPVVAPTVSDWPTEKAFQLPPSVRVMV